MPAEFKNISQAQKAFLGSGGVARFGESKGNFQEVNLDQFSQILFDWGVDLIEKARQNLIAQDKISFGDLSDSFEAAVNFAGTTYRLSISMADYWDFVNKGVQGSDPQVNINKTSPYKFSGRYYSVPVEKIKRWIVQNGLVNRTDNYRVANKIYKRKRLDIPLDPEAQLNAQARNISRSIYRKGLRYSGYWDKALADSEQDLRTRLAAATRSALVITIKNVFPKK